MSMGVNPIFAANSQYWCPHTFMKRISEKADGFLKLGLVVGKCEICTKIYGTHLEVSHIWPCNIKDCRGYETNISKQHAHHKIKHGGEMGSGLGQIDF